MIAKLIKYNIWANTLIVDQVNSFEESLFTRPTGGSFGSLRAVMVHLLESDYLWLQRFKGIPLADIPNWQITSISSLKNTWSPLQAEMEVLAEKIKPEEKIDFITRKGAPFTMPFSEIVLHVSHHGSYHRGQLTNMIRDLNQTPVSTDYFIFSTKKVS
jgi:uncharacterized damage-inducible protein DinB